MIALQQPYSTPEEYLTRERTADFKSEYLNGQIYAMAGSSPEHSLITVNIAREISLQLKGSPCQTFSSDMKIRTSPAGLYAYPDLSVVCDTPSYQDEQRDVLTNPTVIVEVLSPSTEAYDRGRKFAQYQTISSLTDYLLVAQDEMRIEHYLRQADNRWLLTTISGRQGSVPIDSIGCTLLLSEVYDKVTVP